MLPPAISLVLEGWAVSRVETEPGQRKCSAESSERSSLATTPEPRRDRLGSLPTPHPRFPPPSIHKIGDLLAAGQTHDAELSLCLIGGAGDQRRRGRPADASPGYQTVRAFQRPPGQAVDRDDRYEGDSSCRFSMVAGR
jgi:hypothetical protein